MKRFLRYLLLALCVGLLILWGLSVFRNDSVAYVFSDSTMYIGQTGWGSIALGRDNGNTNPLGYGFTFSHGGVSTNDYSFRLGWSLPKFINDPTRIVIMIPYWIISPPIFLLTLALWYHPIKNWSRGAKLQGFPVEMKSEAKE